MSQDEISPSVTPLIRDIFLLPQVESPHTCLNVGVFVGFFSEKETDCLITLPVSFILLWTAPNKRITS